jgi:ATP-dependent Clp protease protease subunit
MCACGPVAAGRCGCLIAKGFCVRKKERLIGLMVANAQEPVVVRAEQDEEDDDLFNVFIKGGIYSDGVSADSVGAALAQAGGKPVAMYMNSPGGDVFEARAIQGVMVAYGGPITVLIQGVAASAATIVAMAASKVRMLRGSRYMIHNGWTIAMGDKREMLAVANLLDGFDREVADEYARKTGAPASQCAAWMDAETWMNADEALARGFVDAVDDNVKAKAAQVVRAAWRVDGVYANAPGPVLDAVDAPGVTGAPDVPDVLAMSQAQRERDYRRLQLLVPDLAGELGRALQA